MEVELMDFRMLPRRPRSLEEQYRDIRTRAESLRWARSIMWPMLGTHGYWRLLARRQEHALHLTRELRVMGCLLQRGTPWQDWYLLVAADAPAAFNHTLLEVKR